MARSMIESNSKIFSRLETYCASRSEPILSPGKPRFIKSDKNGKRLLRGLKPGRCLRFGNHRSLVHLYLDDEHYIGTVGFEFEPTVRALGLIDNNTGLTMCILLETQVAPVSPPLAVRDIVEVGEMGEEGYEGHACEAIESLFPKIQVMRSDEPLDEDSISRLFLAICAEECMRGSSWIANRLADSLIALTDLSIPSLPYAAICRSIFDADPRSMFMALYRCIEATYSHQSSRKLINRLGLDLPWHQVAEALEGEIGWHPQEAASLNEVLKYTNEDDLMEICECLRVEIGKDLQASAGRAIYSLRNSIVHFRPGTKEVDIEDIDWNRLCYQMINVVFHVFTNAYS